MPTRRVAPENIDFFVFEASATVAVPNKENPETMKNLETNLSLFATSIIMNVNIEPRTKS